mgnify:CR=1 FL=1
MVTVPRLEARITRSLLERIGSASNAEYVVTQAWSGGRPNECFEAVEGRVAAEGGRALAGWALWKGELLIEAEYYCVWVDEGGRKFDIAQRELAFDRILFVPDDRSHGSGLQVNNLRLNLGSNPVVDYLIEAYDCVFLLENAGERAKESSLSLDGMEAALHHYFTMLKGKLELYAYRGASPDSPCFCGSRKPFHSCHQDDICKAIAKVHALVP